MSDDIVAAHLAAALVSGKTHAMPTQDGLGPNDGDGAEDARAATIQPDEQSTIDPTQMRPAWRSPL